MYYLKRHNCKDFNIEQCKSYDSSAPLAVHKARAQAIADNERVSCDVVDANGSVVFVALTH